MLNRSRAFISFDAMFSIIPILMIILFTLNAAHFFTSNAAERMHRQQVLDKLVSVADYVVKQGAVRTDRIGITDVRYPNWIDSSRVNAALEQDLKQRTGLNSLSIRLTQTLDGAGPGFCIYRIVVADDTKRIAAIHVCGD